MISAYLGWRAIEKQARRRLAFLDGATSLESLTRNPWESPAPPLWRSCRPIRDLDQRPMAYLCFQWLDGHAHEVEIVDYH